MRIQPFILTTLLLLLCVHTATVSALTYYVRPGGSDSHNCTQAQTNNDGNAKLTITSALACVGAAGTEAGAGHTVEVASGTYNEVLVDKIPSGSSDAARFTLKSTSALGAVIRPTTNSTHIEFNTPSHYITIDGFTLDGTMAETAGISTSSNTVGDFHHIIIKNMWFKSIAADGIAASGGEFIEVRNSLFSDGGYSTTGVGGLGYYHGIYASHHNRNWTIDHNTVSNWGGYGVHIFDQACGVSLSGFTVSNNTLTGNADTTGQAGLIANGDNNKIFGNVIFGNGASSSGQGMRISCARDTLVYNNTVYNNGAQGIYDLNSNRSIFRNNISRANGTDSFFEFNSSGQTWSNNICQESHTGCTVTDPLFINAGAGNFGLTSSSPAIDAGIAAIATGVTRAFNGSTPDIGAFERFTMNNCEVGELATNKIVCNASMALNQPIQITNTTGWTWTGGSISSVAVNGNTQLIFTLSGAYGGGASTITYVETTGNVSDSALIGNSLNQRMSGLSGFTVTDNTGGAPAGAVGLSHWRVYLLYGATDSSWVGKCAEDSTDCVVAPGSRLWVRGKLRNSSGSTYATFNLSTRWRYNVGSYVALTGSYVNGLRVLGTGTQHSTVVTDGTTLTPDILTSNGTNVNGSAIRSVSSFPSVALVDGAELEWAQAIDISPSAVAGDVYEMCPFRDDGTALTCTTPVKITIGSFGGSR